MRIYLRIVAICYASGAAVHFSNMLGYGAGPWVDSPLGWRVADVAYAAVDVGAAVGLWRTRRWGVSLFLLAAISQLVLYTVFADHFAFDDEQRQGLRAMIYFHVVTLALFAGLAVAGGKRAIA